MSGFQFPPPPPPPPRTSTSAFDSHQSQFSFQDRGRGRGRSQNHRGRGRGDRGGSRYQQSSRSFEPSQHATNRTSHSFATSTSNPVTQTSNGVAKTSKLHLEKLPPGSHVNPAFLNSLSQSTSNQQNVASRGYEAGQILPRTAAGHKRKLEALRGPSQDVKRSGLPTAPSVPSFGAGLVTSFQTRKETTYGQQSGKDQSRKPPRNSLGLVPRSENPQYSSSESEDGDEDIDEEAMHAELGTTLTFEHNGVVMSLNSVGDLATWKNERRKNWPTKQRLEQKFEEKAQIGQLRSKLIFDAVSAIYAPKSEKLVAKAVEDDDIVRDGDLNPASTGETELKAQSFDEPQIQTVKSSPRIVDKPNEVHEKFKFMASYPTSESEDSDEDEPPEEHTSRPQLPRKKFETVCKYFAAGGSCRNGESCLFRHELRSSANTGPFVAKWQKQTQPESSQSRTHLRKQMDSDEGTTGIYKMFVEKELEDGDGLALQVIEFLGESAFFTD